MPRNDAARRRDLQYRRRRRGLEFDEEGEQALFEYQGGACFLCGEPISGSGALDHDKKTGEVRGIAHQACNRGIGIFNDDPAALRRAANALENPPWRQIIEWEPEDPAGSGGGHDGALGGLH